MRTILFYRLPGGRCPVEDFLDSLPAQQAKKVVWVLQLVEDIDPVPQQYFKKLSGSDDLWEIRAKAGGEQVRFLCFFDRGAVIVLTHGFIKKTQKIQRREIELATQRKMEYLARKNK